MSTLTTKDCPLEPDFPRKNPNENQPTAAARAISYVGDTFASIYSRFSGKRILKRED